MISLRRKTSSRGLGTVEALMSVMGDMQALVMELKNLVEQCLASERAVQVREAWQNKTNEFSVRRIEKIIRILLLFSGQWRTYPEPCHVRCAWSLSLWGGDQVRRRSKDALNDFETIRYVLPYNQVPSHYHKLLGFPTGLQVC